MPFWTFLLIYAATFVLTELLRPKPRLEDAKPAGLGDFNVPTATEGRPVPVIWGRVLLKGPNVVWYGDLQADPIREKVKTGLFSSDKVTVGYRYKIGLQMALCRGNPVGSGITLRNIRIDESAAWGEDASTADTPITPADTGTTYTINQPSFFGGEDSGGGGGIVGSGTVFPGNEAQSVSGYLAAFQSPIPAYRGTFYLTWEAGEIGLAPQLRPWEFELERYPDGLDLATLQPGDEIVDFGANPMNVIFEALTDSEWGLNLGQLNIDLANFRAIAATLATEGQGFAFIWDRKLDAREIIRTVEDQVDGVLYQDPTTGLWSFRLIRFDYTPGTLRLIDESNTIKLTRFGRPSWGETQNMIQAEFQDRSKNYTTSFGVAQDMANVDIIQAVKSASVRFPGVKTAALANVLAWRELRQLAFPSATGEIVVDRTFYDLIVGDVVELSWDRLGITRLPIRITKIDRGRMLDGKIKLNFTQDIFQVDAGVFADPPPTGWVPPTDVALAPLAELLLEVPYRLTALTTSSLNTTQTQVATIVVRDGGLHVGYNIFGTTTDLPGTAANPTENDVIAPGFSSGFAPRGLLTAALDRGETNGFQDAVGFTIDNLTDVIGNLENATADELEAQKNIALIDNELILFSTVTDNGNGTFTISDLIRGALDTIPADHADNAPVYFISYGLGLLNEIPFSDGTQNVQVRVQTFTPFNTLPFGSTTQIGTDTDSRAAKIYPPRGVQVNAAQPGGGYFPTDIVGTFAITWAGSDKTAQAFATAWDDAHVVQEASSGFRVRIIEDPAGLATVKLDISGVPVSPTGGAYTAAGYCDDTVTDTYRIEVSGVNAAGESQVWGVTFTVYGYGYDYGNNYGGDNDGVIVPRGDPPAVVDPIPGVSTEYVARLTLAGTFDNDDDLIVSVSFFDFAENAFQVENYTIIGTSLSNQSLAGYIAELATQIRADYDPLKVNVTQSGNVLTLSSFFGSLSLDVSNNTTVASTSELQPASGVTSGRAARYHLDVFQLDNQGFEVLSPSFSEEFNTSASAQIRPRLFGLTYEARNAVAANGQQVNLVYRGFESSGGVGAVPYSRALLGTFNDPLDIEPLQAELAQLFGVDPRPDAPGGKYSGFASGVSAGTISPVPLGGYQAQRAGVIVTMALNYGFECGLFHETTPPNTPYGPAYRILTREAVPPIEGYPDGATNIYRIGFTRRFDNNGNPLQSLVAGQVFYVEINGTRFSYTVQASDVADAPYIDNVFTQLGNQIDANPSYSLLKTNTLLREPGGATFITSIEIEGGTNVSLGVEAGGSFGIEFTVENFTQ